MKSIKVKTPIIGLVLILTFLNVLMTSCEEAENIDENDNLDTSIVWQDPKYKLIWQKDSDNVLRTWDESFSYCNDLILDDFTDWRLPTIDELRSILIGCPYSELGVQSCKIPIECEKGTICEGCSGSDRYCNYCGPVPGEGPGVGGCFMPSNLYGECGNYFTNSKCKYKNNPGNAILEVNFRSGSIGTASYVKNSNGNILLFTRCVRGELDRSQIVEHRSQVDCKPGQGCE